MRQPPEDAGRSPEPSVMEPGANAPENAELSSRGLASGANRGGAGRHSEVGTHRRRELVAIVMMVPLLAGLALAAFAWPAARLAPRDVPIGVVAPAGAGLAIEQRLTRDGDTVEVHRLADEASARAAIAGREIYGAIVLAPDGATVLTASAASPLVAQLLQQSATARNPAGPDTTGGPGSAAPSGSAAAGGPGTSGTPGRSGSATGADATRADSTRADTTGADAAGTSAGVGGSTPVRVVDVVAADPDDPRGAALAASVLPLVLAGMAAGVLLWLAGGAGVVPWGALLLGAAGAGLAAVGIAQGWLGVLGGDWLVNAGAFGLTVLAVGAAVAGLAMLFGRAGAALGALLMVLVGNPLSAVSSAPELLPEPAGAIGQLLPPGAGGSLLRGTAFFDGAGAAAPLAVLSAWVLLGLLAAWVASLRGRRSSPAAPADPATRPDPVAVP